MPIGARVPGVATGPAIPPRDPALGWPRPPGTLPAATADGLRVIRYDEVVLRGQTPEGVPLDLVLRVPDGPGFLVLVDRIIVVCFGGSVTTCAFYRQAPGGGAVSYREQVEYTSRALFDIAEEVPPLIFPAQETLTARFDNVGGSGPGAYDCQVRYQFRVAWMPTGRAEGPAG